MGFLVGFSSLYILFFHSFVFSSCEVLIGLSRVFIIIFIRVLRQPIFIFPLATTIETAPERKNKGTEEKE